MKIINIRTDDGLGLTGLLGESPAKDTIIVHVHGMQGSFYESMEPYFMGYAAEGIAFLAGENRGSYIAKRFLTSTEGKVVGGAYEIFEECVHDIRAWIDYAEAKGYKNIWLSAHSLASAKVAYYMHQTHDQRVKGLIFLSPADNVGLVKDPEGAADHALCYPEAQQLKAKGKGLQLLSHLLWGDKVLSADTYLSLFSDDSNANIFHYYDPSQSWKAVHSLSVPVVAITGTKDDGIAPVLDPYAAMNTLEAQLTGSPKVKTIVLDGAEHSFQGFEDRIIECVCDFIQSRMHHGKVG